MTSDRRNRRDTEITQVATASSEIEAMMWRDALAGAGITAMIRPGGPGMGAWASAATFEHAVYVREDQVDAARRVLDNAVDLGPERPRGRRRAPVVNRRSLHTPE